MTIRGFYEDHSILSERFEWERHPAGHPVCLIAQPGEMADLLCQLVTSGRSSSVSTSGHADHSNLVRLTDLIMIIMHNRRNHLNSRRLYITQPELPTRVDYVLD